MGRSSKRPRLVALVVVLASALALVAWWSSRRDAGRAATPAARPAEPARPGPTDGVLVRIEGAGEPSPDPGLDMPVGRLRQNLEVYKQKAVFPPSSRPHGDDTEYMLRWADPIVEEGPMDDRPGRATIYRYGADRPHVMYGDALVSWIEVHPPGKPDARVPVKIVSAFVVAPFGPTSGNRVELTYHDDGRDGDAVAGDHRYTNRLVPSQEATMARAERVNLQAIVETDGIQRLLVRDFTYTPRPIIDVLRVTDAIEDGSLAITLDVEVHVAGRFQFELNCLSGDGETPIAWAKDNFTLAQGKQQVKLVVFGKIFHDKALDGPYLITDLHGMRRVPLESEEMETWWSSVLSHRTSAYKIDDFSAAEWDSEEKRQTIANFERLIAEEEARQAARP